MAGAAWKHGGMADEGGWASPSGEPRREEPPRYGERVPGWTPPSAPQQEAVAGPQAVTGYAPPPKRGLVPLHPLSFGQLLGAAFAVIRWNPKASIVPALIITVVQNALVLGVTSLIAFSAIDRFQRATNDADRDAILAGIIGVGSGGALLVTAISVFGSALLQGMLVTVVARATVGERPGIRAVLRLAIRRVLPLAAVALLLTAVQVVAIAVLALLVIGIATAGTVGVVLAILVGILGGLGFLVAYGFLAIKLTTVPSTIVLERMGIFASIGRSWVLMRGAFWRTFGLLAVVVLIVGAATQLVSVPFSVIGGGLGGVLFPNAGNDLQGTFALSLLTSIPALIVSVIIGGIGQIAQVAAVVLVYLDRRMRREGLDLELRRFVEEGGPDPFERAG